MNASTKIHSHWQARPCHLGLETQRGASCHLCILCDANFPDCNFASVVCVAFLSLGCTAARAIASLHCDVSYCESNGAGLGTGVGWQHDDGVAVADVFFKLRVRYFADSGTVRTPLVI